MNKVIMMGRLTRDPEVRYSQGANGQSALAHFGIAVNRRYKTQGQDTDFFNCSAFGKQAEFVEKYLHKGTKILITGEVRNNSYTNKDGVKVNATEIAVNEIEFAESKSAQQSYQQAPTGNGYQQNGQQAPAGNGYQQNPPQDNGFMTIPDGIEEELPFI